MSAAARISAAVTEDGSDEERHQHNGFGHAGVCLSDHLGAKKHDGPRDEGREGLKMQNADGIDRAGGAGDDQQERNHETVRADARELAQAKRGP